MLPFFYFQKIARNEQDFGGFCLTYTLWANRYCFIQKKIIYFVGIKQAEADYAINTNKYFRARRFNLVDVQRFCPYNRKSKAEKGVNRLPQITLKAARVNIGKTLKEAASEFGIHYETLSNYEADSTNVPRTFFIKLEAVYGISTENIYFGKYAEYIAALKEDMLKQEA